MDNSVITHADPTTVWSNRPDPMPPQPSRSDPPLFTSATIADPSNQSDPPNPSDSPATTTHVCAKCGSKFNHYKSLNSHMRIHKNPRSVQHKELAQPAHYQHTRGPKSKSSAMKSFWANMSPEERTKEMKRRHAITRSKLTGKPAPIVAQASRQRSPSAPSHDQVKTGAADFLPNTLTTESIDHWISEYQSRIHVLEQFRQTVSTWQHP